MLTQDLLNELYDYNPETGEFKRKGGSAERHRDPSRYQQANINGKMHRVHRLIWLMMYGEIPNGMVIDHINGDRQDNRLCNLRLATRQQNAANQRLTGRGCTGYKGVHRRGERYAAYISLNNRSIYIGTFDTPQEAARAYDQRAVELYGEYAKTNVVLGLLAPQPIHEEN